MAFAPCTEIDLQESMWFVQLAGDLGIATDELSSIVQVGLLDYSLLCLPDYSGYQKQPCARHGGG